MHTGSLCFCYISAGCLGSLNDHYIGSFCKPGRCFMPFLYYNIIFFTKLNAEN